MKIKSNSLKNEPKFKKDNLKKSSSQVEEVEQDTNETTPKNQEEEKMEKMGPIDTEQEGEEMERSKVGVEGGGGGGEGSVVGCIEGSVVIIKSKSEEECVFVDGGSDDCEARGVGGWRETWRGVWGRWVCCCVSGGRF